MDTALALSTGESPPARNLPPMLLQYLDYKRQYPDCLLLFQVGDFYELFFEDAVTASKALNLTLTTRDKSSADPVPMAGVPVASVDGYITRLVQQGFSVALVSQVDSRPAAGRGGVDRRLERVITPGISLLNDAADDRAAGVIAAVFIEPQNPAQSDIALAFTEVQSGIIYVREGIEFNALLSELQRVSPAEIILPHTVNAQRTDRRLQWVREAEKLVGERGLKLRPESYFDLASSSRRRHAEISGYAVLTPAARKAARLLLGYIDEVLVSSEMPVREITPKSYSSTLSMDAVTRRTLEVVANARDGSTSGTLFEFMNRCSSSGGARLLRASLLNPLTDISGIAARFEVLRLFKERHSECQALRDDLKYLCDIERVAARIELAAALPRELAALREALRKTPQIAQRLENMRSSSGRRPEQVSAILTGLKCPQQAATMLEQLSESPPHGFQEGGIMADGVNAELDHVRQIRKKGKAFILELEALERSKSGIASLKIRFNNVLGYFFEVTQANAARAPEYFIRRQSTANTERFTTVELKGREQEVLQAEARELELEKNLFFELRKSLLEHVAAFRSMAQAFSLLDMLLCFAELAERENLSEPQIDSSSELEIEEGRHAVLAGILGNAFIPNTLHMADKRCLVITGPNMGGKSTYLRQTGLIVIMAQCGSFVPARRARIGIVDRVFARMGASDDLAEGESTFMVEMREAANIVANATPRSLLLVDEIGRGTATADGLALARAILEWFVLKLNCRVLFATHFHELTALEGSYAGLSNLSVGAVEREGHVIFTHQIKHGAASKSYGIEVARLAGLPTALLQRARDLLGQGINGSGSARAAKQLGFFDAPAAAEAGAYQEPADYVRLKGIEQQLRDLDPNHTSPIEALNFMNSLREKILSGA